MVVIPTALMQSRTSVTTFYSTLHRHSVFKRKQGNIFQKHWPELWAYFKMILYFTGFFFKTEISFFIGLASLQTLCQGYQRLFVGLLSKMGPGFHLSAFPNSPVLTCDGSYAQLQPGAHSFFPVSSTGFRGMRPFDT